LAAQPGAALQLYHLVAKEPQRPRGGDGRIEDAQAARRRVAWIGIGLLACLRLPAVKLLESVDGHIGLAADNQTFRGLLRAVCTREGDAQGKSLDCAQIRGYVLALHAVAPGCAKGKAAILVMQDHRQTVDLGLHNKGQLGVVGGQQPQGPIAPGAQLLGAEGIGQAEHGPWVPDGGELFPRLAAHPLGGRVGRAQLGVLSLQLLELAVQSIVGGVADDGVIEHVVTVVVVANLLPQLLDPLGGVHAVLLTLR
jgi:hypothetical protein